MSVRRDVDDLGRLEAVCLTCLRAVAEAYEDAGVRGLCGEGRWEAALAAVRAPDPDAHGGRERAGRRVALARHGDVVLERGNQVPDITVRRIDGTTFAYGDIWQRRNLLLVGLAGEGAGHDRAAAYAAGLAAHDAELQACETAVVVTLEPVAGLPSPAVLIADRWGEIVAVERASAVQSLPCVDDVLEWVRFVAHACPECEGEAR